MKSLLKILAAAVLAISLTTGLAAAATGTIDTTGPESYNAINHENEVDTDVEVSNDTNVDGEINQEAASGDAKVAKNTNAGDAESGDAENEADAEVVVENDNSDAAGCGCAWDVADNDASIDTTGPHSTNEVNFANKYNYELDIENNTDVNANVNQSAYSGDAGVYKNTNGGSATTGSASNKSSLKIHVNNQN